MDKGLSSTIEKFLKLIQKKYSGVEKAFLFGSFAKGIPKSDSDIDLAVVFDELDDSNRFDMQVQLMLLASKIDNRIEPHPFSRSEFNSGNPFVVEIRKTGLEIAV